MAYTPVKGIPTRTDPRLNSPTRPENILKKCSTTPDPFQFGLGKLGVSGCPAGLYSEHAELV